MCFLFIISFFSSYQTERESVLNMILSYNDPQFNNVCYREIRDFEMHKECGEEGPGSACNFQWFSSMGQRDVEIMCVTQLP